MSKLSSIALISILLANPVLAGISSPKSKCETSLTAVRKQFKVDINYNEDLLARLTLNLNGYVPTEFLGHGSSGIVLKVSKGRRDYALKVFDSLWEGNPDHSNPKYMEEVTVAIAIQHTLGTLGISPKIIGIAPEEKIRLWREKYHPNIEALTNITAFTPRYPRFGLLMEYLEGVSFRSKKSGLVLTQAQWQSIQKRSVAIEKKLRQLDIQPEDPDVMITPTGEIFLFDVGFYKTGLYPSKNTDEPFEYGEGWLWERLLSIRSQGKVRLI